MPQSLPVLINRSGGTAAGLGDRLEQTIRTAFAGSGRSITLELLEGGELAEAIRRHCDAPTIAVGGGDGSLRSAAQALAGTQTALAILPLGTRNHLAQALGVPLDLGEAAGVAATGERRRMDLGRVDGRIFVNNASVGLYPQLVRERDRRNLPKWLGTVPAAWRALKTMQAHRYLLTVDSRARELLTPLLFVGNNRYSLEPATFGERESLSDGELSLCAVRAERALQLARVALKVLIGRASPAADFDELDTARSIILEAVGDHRSEIGVALDGEVMQMKLPLRFEILPSALGVVTAWAPAGRAALLSRTG